MARKRVVSVCTLAAPRHPAGRRQSSLTDPFATSRPWRVRLPAREQAEAVWERVRAELRGNVPDFTFHIWLSPLELAAIRGHTLFVRAPDHVRTLVRDRYCSLLREAAARVFSPQAVVEIVDRQWQPVPEAEVGPGADASSLNPKYSFEQFVIGEENRFAHGAALAVAETPGQTYNPLFIHGEPGLGKTHLLHAIGNFVLRHGGGLTVRYATGEEFTSEFIGAIRPGGNVRAFKERFRGVDVLLLDDVQFLAEKVATEEELFHTFNVLRESGRQLVMTSDRTPGELAGLEQRLSERFASGLVVGIGAPDIDVRQAILHSRSRIDDLDVPPEVLAEIASRVTRSVRALEAALVQVVAYASLRGEQLSPDLAARLLGRLHPDRKQQPATVDDIVTAVATQMQVAPQHVLARDRRPPVVLARKVAMKLARELTALSLPQIGRAFGGRDHSTVLSALRSVERDLEADPALAATVDDVRRHLSDPS